jgi:hypothetical protein
MSTSAAPFVQLPFAQNNFSRSTSPTALLSSDVLEKIVYEDPSDPQKGLWSRCQ